MEFSATMELVGRTVDAAGVAAIVVGALVATLLALAELVRPRPGGRTVYTRYRRRLGRSILLGLELLVAADIIRTVAITPTFESVGVLALIVLIRTFLSWSLELEISGRWPWQKEPAGAAGGQDGASVPAAAEGGGGPER
ncbi:DUF1622 domain-containing protein [Kocuria flava]|uniref:DUF1622 domain-containing protein n=1 Tax=Kocuria flava TaxID=446860 RepID=UPI003F1A312C